MFFQINAVMCLIYIFSSPGLRTFTCYADRPEPKCGLEPRFEALPKTGKSPNTPGGVTAKAVTPHPQPVNILSPSDSLIA